MLENVVDVLRKDRLKLIIGIGDALYYMGNVVIENPDLATAVKILYDVREEVNYGRTLVKKEKT